MLAEIFCSAASKSFCACESVDCTPDNVAFVAETSDLTVARSELTLPTVAFVAVTSFCVCETAALFAAISFCAWLITDWFAAISFCVCETAASFAAISFCAWLITDWFAWMSFLAWSSVFSFSARSDWILSICSWLTAPTTSICAVFDHALLLPAWSTARSA